MPDVPGVMTSASSFSTSTRWYRLRALPAAAPATPRATAPPTIVAGRKIPATTPPTMPHLRPFRVLCSVIFWMWILPSSSALATRTPSMWSEPSISASSSWS